MTTRASEADIQAALAQLPEWVREGEAITRTLEFADFVVAFGFMAEVALHAERAGHHPDWQNVYRTVSIRLSTHDAGGLTSKDFALAATIDAVAARHLRDA